MSASLIWLPIDDRARDGRSWLVRDGAHSQAMMAVGRWDGERFVYPATGGLPLDIEPFEYHFVPEGHRSPTAPLHEADHGS